MSGAAPVTGDRGVGARLGGTRFGPVRWFATIDSTNRFAADAAARGGANGLVVVADEQEAGRGRLGRRWDAPPGASLLVSVVVGLDDAREHLPLVTPAAALAAADALEPLAGIDARIKWPNDLVVDDRKLAGVLAEVVQGTTVVVGMGLNVQWTSFPEEHAGIATACNLLSSRPVDRGDLLVAWLARYDELLGQLATPSGRSALRDSVAARSATLGREVRAELPERVVAGVASALLTDGTLEVTRTDGVREVIAAGDVVHLRPAPRDTPA
jgi:BirA family biotin operon repressor/biotin-[acetyl-CoA-carboxylase] ligase